MYNYDLYTGELSTDGSPTDSKSELSQQEIVNNANMMFDTDPQSRYQQMQYQQQMYQPQQPNYYGYQQQPYYGYGYGPQQPQQNPFMNQPSGFSGYAGNPAYQYMQNNGMRQPMYSSPVQDYTYFVQGYNPGGTSRMLLPDNAYDICSQMQIDMNEELEEDYEKRVERQQEYYSELAKSQNYAYPNYYQMPYMQQQYYNPAIVNKYRGKIESMRTEAEQHRIDLNKHLSKLCHNYRGDDVDEETIDAIYDGYTVTIPGTHIEESREYQRMCSAQVIDTTLPIRMYDDYVSQEYKKYVNENTGMNDFFTAVGQVIRDEMLEEEAHRRKDLSLISMPTTTYRELIRRRVNKSREAANPSFTIPRTPGPGENIPMGSAFPTLNDAAKMLDDGTLEIHAPDWLGGKKYAFKNVEEDEYEINRKKFVDSIYASENPLNSGGGSNGG